MNMEPSRTITEIKSESQSSYEFGKASNRFKLYFWNVEELNKKLLLTQRRLATSDIHLVSVISALRWLPDAQKLKALTPVTTNRIQATITEINKSDNPLDIAAEFISEIAKW